MIVQDVQFQETAVKQPQELGLADIDPEKLSSKLEKLFPTDPVEVYVKHNAYSIQAPRPLSHAEIAECTVMDNGSSDARHHSQHHAEGKHHKGKWPMVFRAIWGRAGWF